MSSNHVPNHPKLKNMSSIADLCQGLVETEKSTIYPLADRLIRLIFIFILYYFLFYLKVALANVSYILYMFIFDIYKNQQH